MIRKILIFYILALNLLFSLPVRAAQQDNPGDIDLSVLDMEAVEQVVRQLDDEIQQAVPQLDFRSLTAKLARGELEWNISEVFNWLIKFIFNEVLANLLLLGKLVVLAIITAVLQNLMTAFEKATVGKIAYFICYLVLITLAVGTFTLTINIGREAVDNMVIFMQALLPLLLTLLAAMGGIASSTLFHPIILGSITVMGTVIKNVVLPLIFFAAVLSVVNGVSAKFKVSRMADLFKTAGMTILGLCSTVFMGILAVQGVAGSVSDGVALRTAKFTTDAFVPVVGGTLSDALEAVMGSALLMKNAVGVAGVVVIALLTVLPLVKILAIAFVYRLAGAVVQPVGDGQMADCLTGLGNSLIMVFGAVATVGLLFFFAITIVVGMGNLTVMLR
ncbi:stage III sporulation protein AE [Desulfohalotomaculum tongense]|uniref:stage III sporulation protein AE n=1 Tax=Desulforadius tongensis TaxID=1216062 RepID=UPI00195F16C7|nr:stage III sporulation protein AE [Desulforadius tongensis]MBM7855483.1 stage III sporulation protein AE [Desulforadius tongensis]